MNQEMKFEQAIKRLEEIIEKLESGVEDLDELVTLYEEGSKLIRYCGSKLTEVESKIEIISKNLSKQEEKDKNDENIDI